MVEQVICRKRNIQKPKSVSCTTYLYNKTNKNFMKTHKVRPVLVESQETKSQNLPLYTIGECIKQLSDVKIGELQSIQRVMFSFEYFKPMELILISLEDEKIEVGNEFYSSKYETIDVLASNGVIDEFTSFKVIARQSQISPEYISKFIEQYNNDCIENLEIKCGGSYEEFLDFCGKLGYDYDGAFGWYKRTDPGGNRPNTSTLEDLFNKYPKLTNGSVTIVEKEPISYTEGEVLNLLHKLELDKNINLAAWFENNKKK